jgi:uracil phosphoribosyltransferase
MMEWLYNTYSPLNLQKLEVELKECRVKGMKIQIADHPLITHKLTLLRDEKTDSPTFRSIMGETTTLLAYEAMREIKTHLVTVKTPVANAHGAHITKPTPVVVPILRAGLGMLEGMSRLMPTAEIGFLGMVRNEKTLKASTYANRLPKDLTNRQCYILDPMLATGGTLVSAIEFLAAKGAVEITAICILAAPEGIANLEKVFSQSKLNLKLLAGALDKKLNEKGYIIPGLGDAGNRLYGVI